MSSDVALVDAVAVFLGLSLLLYCLLGGADFGAGMLENFMGRKRRREQSETISHAISPVWEANHMWLVLGLVILFVGFPKAYAAMSVTFHIPLTLLLLGIVLRGCAFTFRQYDAVKDRSQAYYSWAFRFSSFLSSLMLGVIAGGLLVGGGPPASAGFFAAFVASWLNLFCFAIGGFTCAIFVFLASVYLVGESTDPAVQKIFLKRAQISNVLVILGGALVFLAAHVDGFPLLELFILHSLSLIAMVIATLLLLPLWWSLRKRRTQWARILAAGQVTMILLGWFNLQYPVMLVDPATQESLSLYTASAPAETLRMLLYALLGGSVLIFPALIYLLRVFKIKAAA